MIDLMQIPTAEAERLAYAEGFTGTATLLARLADAEAQIERLRALARTLVQHVREDVDAGAGTRHLWDTVDDVERAIEK